MPTARARIFAAAFCLVLTALPVPAFSEESDAPWEAEDLGSPRRGSAQRPQAPAGLFASALDALLDIYQRGQSEKTVRRCAFYTSCSAFLPRAIDAYGFPIGFLAFFDRYLYRENKSAYALYPLKKRPDGVYKLDDDSFLEP